MDNNKQLKVAFRSGVEAQGKYQSGVAGDPEMDGLTLYGKKALLVHRELDSQGTGKYQWYNFFLCGLGIFSTLCERKPLD